MNIQNIKKLSLKELLEQDTLTIDKALVHIKNIIYNKNNSIKDNQENKSLDFSLSLERLTNDKENLFALRDVLNSQVSIYSDNLKNAIINYDIENFNSISAKMPNLFGTHTFSFLSKTIQNKVSAEHINFFSQLLNHNFFNPTNKFNNDYIKETLNKEKYNIKEKLQEIIILESLEDIHVFKAVKSSNIFNEKIFQNIIDNKMKNEVLYTIDSDLYVQFIKENNYNINKNELKKIISSKDKSLLNVLFDNNLINLIEESEELQVSSLNIALSNFSFENSQFLMERYKDNLVFKEISIGDFINRDNIYLFLKPQNKQFRNFCLEQFYLDDEFLNILAKNLCEDKEPHIKYEIFEKIVEKNDIELIKNMRNPFTSTKNMDFNVLMFNLCQKTILNFELHHDLEDNSKRTAQRLKL